MKNTPKELPVNQGFFHVWMSKTANRDLGSPDGFSRGQAANSAST
jgi:hypothetical protein